MLAKQEELSLLNLDRLWDNEIVYVEISELGAMGNAGGVMIYALRDGNWICYEVNHINNESLYDHVYNRFVRFEDGLIYDLEVKSKGVFDYHYGGAGNRVLINKTSNLQILEDHFVYQNEGSSYIIKSSVLGVFNSVRHSLQNSRN